MVLGLGYVPKLDAPDRQQLCIQEQVWLDPTTRKHVCSCGSRRLPDSSCTPATKTGAFWAGVTLSSSAFFSTEARAQFPRQLSAAPRLGNLTGQLAELSAEPGKARKNSSFCVLNLGNPKTVNSARPFYIVLRYDVG